MILLLEPPRPQGRISGGYRYNGELARRLESTGLGGVVSVAAEHLAGFGFVEEDVIVLDSLYLTSAEPPPWLAERVRTVLLLHYLPSLDPTRGEQERAALAARERVWFEGVDRIVTTSARLAEHLREQHGQLVASATPGVSPCFRPFPGDEPGGRRATVVSVGTLAPAKGQLELARLLAHRAAGGDAPRLVLIGDATYDTGYVEAIRAAAGDLELEITGCLAPEEVADHLRRARLFVSASAFESYGMAVAEAIATGVPVVAYRVGEVDRWVHESENGYLVEPGDVRSLGRVLDELLADPARLDSLRDSDRTIFFPSWEYTFARFLRAVRSDALEGAREEDEPEATFYSSCQLPTHLGQFEVEVYRLEDGEEALLIFMGDLGVGEPPFVRVHSECFTGEILGSLKCDCRRQLDAALQEIAARGRGAVVYLRQEGRGIGLGNKIRAYAEQEKGADTIEANEMLGFPADLRDFRVAALMLEGKGVGRVALYTNNPNKVTSLEANGITVERVIPSSTDPNPHNLGYLVTKYHAMGHAGLERALHGVGALPHGGRVGRSGNGSLRASGRKPLLLFDLDGVLQLDDVIPEEARTLIERLRAEGFPIRFLTNDGINSRKTRLEELTRLGLEVTREELYTASHLTARYVAENGGGPVLPLFGRPALEEFEGIPVAEGDDARTVVVGDYFPHYDYAALKRAYDALANGAELIAMHRKRSWPTGGKRVIDIGFWVSGLEFCAGRAATIVGKPSAYSYLAVLADAGYAADEAIMISDESDPDLDGAREAGLRTMLFREAGAAGPGATYEEIWERLSKGVAV